MREGALVHLVHRCIQESPNILRLESDVTTLKSDVTTLKSDVATLKSDVATLKSDVATLKSDVATLKSDVATLKSDVASLRTELSRQGILAEATQADMRTVMDAMMGLTRRFDEAIRARDTIEWSTYRLDAVEDGLKRHIKNRKAHRTTGASRSGRDHRGSP